MGSCMFVRWFVLINVNRFKKEKQADASINYSFMGYVTFYPFFYFPDKRRMRISQFLILPPYQRQGHGSKFLALKYKRTGKLYRFLFNQFLSRSEIHDFGGFLLRQCTLLIAVEDPNDSFTDMRDLVDVKNVLETSVFSELKPPVPYSKIQELQTKFKFSKV